MKYDDNIEQCYVKQKEIVEEFALSYKNARKEEGKFVYAISQLNEDDVDGKSPCSHGVTSRWRKETGRCNENIEIHRIYEIYLVKGSRKMFIMLKFLIYFF